MKNGLDKYVLIVVVLSIFIFSILYARTIIRTNGILSEYFGYSKQENKSEQTNKSDDDLDDYYYSFNIGIIFKYDPDKYDVVPDYDAGNVSIISKDRDDKEKFSGIIISTSDDGLNAIQWLDSGNADEKVTKTLYEKDIDGESAYRVNNENWIVFDGPKDELRYSIASIGNDKEVKPEFDKIVNSLFFVRCPQDYIDEDKKNTELAVFLNTVMTLNASTTPSELAKARVHFYKEYGCKEALERFTDFQNDKVDPETQKMFIDAVKSASEEGK